MVLDVYLSRRVCSRPEIERLILRRSVCMSLHVRAYGSLSQFFMWLCGWHCLSLCLLVFGSDDLQLHRRPVKYKTGLFPLWTPERKEPVTFCQWLSNSTYSMSIDMYIRVMHYLGPSSLHSARHNIDYGVKLGNPSWTKESMWDSSDETEITGFGEFYIFKWQSFWDDHQKDKCECSLAQSDFLQLSYVW